MKPKFLTITFCLFILASSVFAQANEAKKIDEFGEIICDEIISRLNNLEYHLRDKPQSTAFVIVYEGKRQKFFNEKKKYILPKFGESIARTKTMQERLRFLKYDPKKFTFIDGGFREKYTVEFWIIPKGATPPKPTPTLKTMKYRKGNPTNICHEF